MRKLLLVLFCTLFSIPLIRADYKIIDSKWDPYFKSISSSDVTAIPKLLVGEEIYISTNNSEHKQFINITPDTIWIKRKKNPKLNKHYRLMPFYHGVERKTYSYVNSEYEYTQYTPSSEIENVAFRVDSVSEEKTGRLNSYSTYHYCHVYLTNVKTSERLIWQVQNSHGSQFDIQSKTLGAKMVKDTPNLYFSDLRPSRHSKSSDYIKTSITSSIYYANIASVYSSSPNIKITLSNNNTITFPPAYSYTKLNIINENEYQNLIDKEKKDQEAELEARKVYTIDSKYTIDSTYTSLPFSFRHILGITKGGYVRQSINRHTSSYDGKYLSSDKIILIADKLKMHGRVYYIGLLEDKCFYIPESDVTIPDEERPKLDTLLSCDTTIRKVYFNWSKSFQNYRNARDTKELLDELKSHTKYGLSIEDWGVYDESEYTDGTGIKFKFYNPTKKMIKYITITFVGYNAVDDPVSSYEGGSLTRKCIGPIEPDESASYEFEYVWFTDIVQYAKIKSIVVQYNDNTTKRITNADKITWSDELSNLLNDPILEGFDSLEKIGNK